MLEQILWQMSNEMSIYMCSLWSEHPYVPLPHSKERPKGLSSAFQWEVKPNLDLQLYLKYVEHILRDS